MFTEDLTKHYQVCSSCEQVVSEEGHNFEYDASEYDNICTKCNLQHDFDTNCSGEIQSVKEGTCERIRYICKCGNELTMVGNPGDFTDYCVYDEYGYCEICDSLKPGFVPDQTRPTYPDEPTDPENPEESDPTGCQHSWTEIIIEPAECDASGEKQAVCNICGEEGDIVTIPATGHKWISGEITLEPDCGTPGEREIVCENCDEPGGFEEIPPTNDHELGDWEEVDAPQVGIPGLEQRDCTNCDYYETREIPALQEDSAAPEEASLFDWPLQNRIWMAVLTNILSI
jgi:hypothetical protein